MNESLRVAYGKALVELGIDRRIVVLDGDLISSTKTGDFGCIYPNQFFNAGIAEQNMLCVAAGLSMNNKIVFVNSFANFLIGRGWEQIRNTIARDNLNVKIVAAHGGITVGEDGSSHQAVEDIAIMRAIPNMKIIVPCDSVEVNKLVRKAAYNLGPFYVRLCRDELPVIHPKDYSPEIGVADKIADGDDISIISNGIMVHDCLEAVKETGISADILNIHTIKPLDEKAVVDSAKKTEKVLVVEEHGIIGGLGGAVCETLAKYYPAPVKLIGVNDCFGCSGRSYELKQKFGLTANCIAKEMQGMLKSAALKSKI